MRTISADIVHDQPLFYGANFMSDDGLFSFDSSLRRIDHAVGLHIIQLLGTEGIFYGNINKRIVIERYAVSSICGFFTVSHQRQSTLPCALTCTIYICCPRWRDDTNANTKK